MGLEPTTFCIAKRVVGSASLRRKWLRHAAQREDATCRDVAKSQSVCRRFRAVWAQDSHLCPMTARRPQVFGSGQ